MLVYDNDAASTVEKGKGSSAAVSVKSQDEGRGALATECPEGSAKTKSGQFMHRVMAQLARWGLETNG